jgi:Domain of Unknown Function (DUF1080)
MNKTQRLMAICSFLLVSGFSGFAQQKVDSSYFTELWNPEPRVVTPGKNISEPPSDAIVLFNGKDLSAWKGRDGGPAKWAVADGAFTVTPKTGEIATKEAFGDCQLHVEWKISPDVSGTSQQRGNSGIFLMGKYELQVLDNYAGKTYVNGQAGAIYKQSIPLVNACRPPGEWQTYDIIFTAPRFGDDGRVKSPAIITVLHNGILVQNNFHIIGGTQYIGIANYKKHGDKEPITLQDHGNPTSFRNIWIRPL